MYECMYVYSYTTFQQIFSNYKRFLNYITTLLKSAIVATPACNWRR